MKYNPNLNSTILSQGYFALNVTPVILCGGAGHRLWPLSRAAADDQAGKYPPKHLHALVNEQSLLQNTLNRIADLAELSSPLLVCNQAYGEAVAVQLEQIGLASAQLLLEPEGRNTAPALALAAQMLVARQGDCLLAVMPSDHVIGKPDALLAGLQLAFPLAEAGHLVTFGIVPSRPETGYGYIIIGGESSGTAMPVKQFVEKPNRKKAEALIKTGQCYWNSGMFVFKASVYLDELNRHRPDIAEVAVAAASQLHHVKHNGFEFTSLQREVFSACPAESIDRAVMEATDRAMVMPLDVGWSDLGSWESLWQLADRDDSGNSIKGDVMTDGVSNSYIRAEHRQVSVLGVSNLVIVETEDAVLITTKAKSQEVKPPQGH